MSRKRIREEPEASISKDDTIKDSSEPEESEHSELRESEFESPTKKLMNEYQFQGISFEIEIEDLLKSNGFCIFGSNIIFDGQIGNRHSNIYELDIILYKTIVECKSSSIIDDKLNEDRYNDCSKQLNLYHLLYPSFIQVLWFKKIIKTSPLYIRLKSEFPDVIITDSIDDFKKEYVKPTEFYYISKILPINCIISKDNTYDYSSLFPKIKVSRKTLDIVRCFLIDETDKINFENFEKKVIITDDFDLFDIKIMTSPDVSEPIHKIERVKSLQKYGITRPQCKIEFNFVIPKVPFLQSPRPLYEIPGIFDKCISCPHFWSSKFYNPETKLCKFCSKKS